MRFVMLLKDEQYWISLLQVEKSYCMLFTLVDRREEKDNELLRV